MLEIYKKQVPIEKIIHDGNTFQPVNPSDFISYKEFLTYFAGISTITKHNLVIGINFTYGWMPRIFQFRSNMFEEALAILNNAKKGVIPKSVQLRVLKELFDNSLVGTTKLLHFINPEVFAIWDGKVYRYLTGLEANGNRMVDYEAYFDYLNFCNIIVKDPAYDNVHQSIIRKIGYTVTKLRSVELIMYSKEGSRRA